VEKMALLVFLALGIAVGKTKCAICAVGFYNEAQLVYKNTQPAKA